MIIIIFISFVDQMNDITSLCSCYDREFISAGLESASHVTRRELNKPNRNVAVLLGKYCSERLAQLEAVNLHPKKS